MKEGGRLHASASHLYNAHRISRHHHNREVVEFIEEERGVRVAAPDEARFMQYTPPQLQRTDLKDLVIVQPEVCV